MHAYLEADHGEVGPDLRVQVIEDVGLRQGVLCLLQVTKVIAGHTHSKPGATGRGLLARTQQCATGFLVLTEKGT